MSDLLPVFWLCGPSGVGKSTLAWELFAGLPAGAAYVDIDQLGMCYPAIPADPGRTRLEGRILGDVVACFRAAGASCLVVSGYIDAEHGIHAEYLTDGALKVLRLRCDLVELRRRLLDRARPGESAEYRELALLHADDLDRGTLPYPVLDTTGRTLAEALSAVRAGWVAPTAGRSHPWPEVAPTPGDIVWVCGAAASGKSTVGRDVYLRSLAMGHMTGFVDLQQIGFFHGAGRHRLQAQNLAALWRRFHERGARRLVVVGAARHAEQERLYREALPAATVTLYRLYASAETLRERVRLRGLGQGPPIAGDALRGQPEAVLERAWQNAVAESDALERVGLGDVRVPTDGRTVAEVAAAIAWAVATPACLETPECSRRELE